jgi:Rieske 2Fe-2S family protein
VVVFGHDYREQSRGLIRQDLSLDLFLRNMRLSLHPDYVNYYLVHPIAPDRTLVESEWLFHPDTLTDETSNVSDAIEFWDVTNKQDWDIIERSQLGVASRRYVPGPYSPRESIPAAWDREYLRLMDR